MSLNIFFHAFLQILHTVEHLIYVFMYIDIYFMSLDTFKKKRFNIYISCPRRPVYVFI